MPRISPSADEEQRLDRLDREDQADLDRAEANAQANALFDHPNKDERKPIDYKAIGTLGHVPINQRDAQTERMEAELSDHIDHTQRPIKEHNVCKHLNIYKEDDCCMHCGLHVPELAAEKRTQDHVNPFKNAETYDPRVSPVIDHYQIIALLMSCATSHMENGDISGSDAITNAIQYARQELDI